MTKMLDRIEQILRGDAPPPPVAKLIGLSLFPSSPVKRLSSFKQLKRTPIRWVHFTAASYATSPTLQWVLPIRPTLRTANPSRRLNSRSTS